MPPPETFAARQTALGEPHSAQTTATLPDAPPLPREVRCIGPYVLRDRIGRGGLGLVFRASREGGQDVALKYLRAGEDATPNERRTFARELEAARRLTHPNILPILDAGEQDGCPWFTMPLVRGGNLEERLRVGLPEARWAVALLAQVARAVHYAHQGNVLHRDIKPANIMLGEEGPLIADFGLARFSDQEGHTVTGQLMGSLPYMSPEQAAGQSHRVGPTTDVWSLGVVLYEMLTGRKPFGGGGQAATLENIRQARFVPPSQVAPVPMELEAAVMRCLRRAPGQRYPSAAALAADLEAWLRGSPPSAEEETTLSGLVDASGLPAIRPLSLLLLPVVLFLTTAALAWAPPKTPEAKARKLLASAAPGRPVDIWPENGVPVWRRVLFGKAVVAMTIRPGMPGVMDTREALLLQLLPADPKRGPYRLRVEVRQRDGDSYPMFGLFACYADGRMGNNRVHRFVVTGYDEPSFRKPVPGVPFVAEERARGELTAVSLIEEPTGTRPSFKLHLKYDVAELPPRPRLGAVWRAVILEVREDGIYAGSDGQKYARLTWADLAACHQAEEVPWKELRGQPRPSGPAQAAGLFLMNGSMEVRRVSYEPLARRGGKP
jgi:hypothetical protein